ncbi:TPA: DUF5662 family protein [Clostridium perfringens]
MQYLKYILEHKKNVFIECWKEGLYLHAFTHDLSKFRPSEFIPYARYFYGDYISNVVLNNVSCVENKSKIRTKEQVKEKFEKAWKLHYKRNKHHWNHWIIYNGEILIDMPEKYIKQMICDWKGMARKFGDTAQEFYMKNYDKIQLTRKSRLDLEFELGLIDGVALVSNMTWKNYCENIGITMKEDLRQLGHIK